MPQPAAAPRHSAPLAPYECRVWWATIADGGPHLEPLLSARERDRGRAYVRPDDRLRFVTGAALVRRAAAACASADPADLRVDRRCRRCGAQHGKPRLPDHPQLDVSVAHSGDVVAVALARGAQVGIDVERVHDVAVDELARSTFAADEAAALAALPAGERLAAFFRLWTSKESVVKAIGTGITDDFASVSADASGAALHELACAPGHVATLAIVGRCDRLTAADAGALLRQGDKLDG